MTCPPLRRISSSRSKELDLSRVQAEDLRLIVVDQPINKWQDPQVQELFVRMTDLKIRGFDSGHATGSLPLSTSDFIAKHILLCLETDDSWLPLSAFWSLDDRRCSLYNLPFAAEQLTEAADSPKHTEAIAAARGRSKGVGRKISYVASWTIHPATLERRKLRELVREQSLASLIYTHREPDPSFVVLGATLRFKVDRLLTLLDFKPLEMESEVLPPIRVRHLHGAEVQIMLSEDFSERALSFADRHQRLWNRRVEL